MRRLQLVGKDSKRGYHIPLETLMQMKSMPQTLKVSCVVMAGKAKSGKSYLLNRLFLEGSKCVFNVNPSVEEGTTGLETIMLRDGDNLLVLIDCEGVDCKQNEPQKQLLALQLASYYIFNSLGPLDEKSLELLGFLLRMADWQGLEPPEFAWVLRDFGLSLRDSDGRSLTEDEYLEKTLMPSGQKGDRNVLRKAFKKLFPYRSLMSMPRPMIDEKRLQNIQSLSHVELRPEFEDKLNLLRMHIGNNLKPKRAGGSILTLGGFVELLETQCKAMNDQGIDFRGSSFFVEKQEISNLLREISEQASNMEEVAEAKDWAKKEFNKRNVYANNSDKELISTIEETFRRKKEQVAAARQPLEEGIVESRLIRESLPVSSSRQTSIRVIQPKANSSTVEQPHRVSKFSDISSIPDKRRETGTDLLAKIIQELEGSREEELRSCKRNMEQCIRKTSSAGDQVKQEQLLRLEVAYLEGQNNFLRLQNRQKQSVINSLLAMPTPPAEDAKYIELLTINRKLSEALKHAQQKLEEIELKKFKSRRKRQNLYDSKSKSQPPHITITETAVRQGPNGKPFIDYRIQVRTAERQHEVHRPFKSFIEMHSILEDLFPGFRQDSPFSLKEAMHMIGSRGTTIAQRCQDLERYLNSLTQIPELMQCDVFRRFIGLSDLDQYQRASTFFRTDRIIEKDSNFESPARTSRRKPKAQEYETFRSAKNNFDAKKRHCKSSRQL